MKLRVAISSACVAAMSCAQIAGVEDGELGSGGTVSGGIGGADASVTGGSAGATTGGAAGSGGAGGSTDAATGYAAVVLADGPVAYYRLGEATTPAAFDSSGNGHDGTYKDVIVGEPGAIANDPDTAVRFKGSNFGGVEVSDVFDFDGKKPFSVELWVKSEVTDSSLMGKSERPEAGAFMGWFLYHDAATTTLRRAGTNVEGPPLIQGAWTYVVATYDGVTSAVYLDGELAAQKTTNSTLPDLTAPLLIGRIDNWKRFAGVLDEVAIYDKNLPPARIKAHYQAGIGQ
jgi:hypothetical protein